MLLPAISGKFSASLKTAVETVVNHLVIFFVAIALDWLREFHCEEYFFLSWPSPGSGDNR